MAAEDILTRYDRRASELGNSEALLYITREGDRLLIQTGTRSIRQSRLLTRIGGLVLALAGIALAGVSLWFLALTVVGALVSLLVPGLFRTTTLLIVDAPRGQLVIAQYAAGAGTELPCAQITGIRGVYETQGWDPRSVLYVGQESGVDLPVLIFRGTDEPLAEYACQTLGYLLECPATYAGPFGESKICYQPVPGTEAPGKKAVTPQTLAEG